MFPEKRKLVLETFYNNPFREAHLREISRLSEVSLCNVDDSMKMMTANEMFKRRNILNRTTYRANLDSDLMVKVFEMLEIERRENFYRKNRKLGDLVKECVRDIRISLKNNTAAIILSGPASRNEWREGMQTDILVIAYYSDEDAVEKLREVEKDIKPVLDVRFSIISADNFRDIIKNYDHTDTIWNGRVVLYNEYFFWKELREKKISGNNAPVYI